MTDSTNAGNQPISVRRGAWLLLLFLSLLPLGLLLWQAEEEDRRVGAESDRHWLAATEPMARRLMQASRLPFWLETASRRCRRWTERDLRRGHGFAAAIERGIREAGIPGLPPIQAWAVEFPDGDPAKPGKPLSGGLLATMSRRMIAGILQGAARQTAKMPGTTSKTAVEGLFGVGTDVELFAPGARGKPFHVLFGLKPALAVWDVVEIGTRRTGAFLLLLPIGLDEPRLALRMLLTNWTQFAPRSSLIPAFMPLPNGPGPVPGRILSLPGLRGARVRKALEAWRNRPRIDPGEALDLDKLNANLPASGTENLFNAGERLAGHLHLGGYHSDLVERIPGESLRARVVPLDPLTRRFGLLIGETPRKASPWQRRAFAAWGVGCGLAWGLGWLLPLLGWSPGVSGVRRELLSWFLALAAIPLTLSLIAALRYQNDLRINLTEGCRQDLLNIFRSLEVGSDRLNDRYHQIFLKEAAVPGIVERVRAVEDGKVSEAAFMDGLLKECQRHGADPMGLLVVGAEGFTLEWFHESVSGKRREMFSLLGENLARPLFGDAGKVGSAALPKSRKPRSAMLSQLLARMTEENQTNRWNQTDRRSQLSAGGKATLGCHSILFEKDRPVYIMAFLWEEERVSRRFLKTEIPLLAHDPVLAMAAFRQNDFALVKGGGEPRLWEPLRNLARRARESQVLVSSERELMVAAPSVQMPGFILTAAMSKEAILRRLVQEWHWMLLFLVGLFLLVMGAAWILAFWLVDPLLAMDRGLRQVAGGNLEMHLGIHRPDELGDASATLDQMTAWLRERQRMSRFVAPQVLDVVATGTSESSMKKAVMLVSDIRSFTTISETYTPQQVFELLNRHLEEMTQVIKRHGGSVDRFIGDAVQAVFFDDQEMAPEVRALAAAREMMAAHHALNGKRREADLFSYDIGIGLAVGEMVVGVVGDPGHRVDLTVLGDALREAAELEAASKLGQSSRIICSPAIRAAVGTPDAFLPLNGYQNGWEWKDAVVVPPGIPCAELMKNGEIAPAERLRVAAAKEWQEPLPGWIYSLVFWLLPLLMMGSMLERLSGSRREQASAQALVQVRETANLLSQTANPNLQTALYMSQELQDGFRKAFQRNPGDLTAMMRRELTPRLRRMQRLFGDCRWSLFSYEPPPDLDMACISRRGVTLLACGGKPVVPPMNVRQAKGMFVVKLSCAVTGVLDSELTNFLNRDLQQWMGENAGRIVMSTARGTGMLIPQKSQTESRLVYWLPLRASDTQPLCLPGDLRHIEVWRDIESLKNIRGGVLIDIAPESLSPDLVRRAMIRRLRHEGFELAFLDNFQRRQSPVFRTDPDLHRMLLAAEHASKRGSRNVAEIIAGRGGWVLARGALAGGAGGDFILARKVSSDGARTGTPLELFCSLFLGVWGIGGLIWSGVPRMGRLPRLSLHIKLVVAFALVLIPVLVVGTLTLERSWIERKTRMERDLGNRLDLSLRSIDTDHLLYLTQQVKLLDEFCRKKEFLLATAREHGLPPSRTLRGAVPDRLYQAFSPLQAAYWSLFGKGINLKLSSVIGYGSTATSYPPEVGSGTPNAGEGMFHDLFAHVLQQLRGGAQSADGPGSNRRDMLSGAKFEEIRDLLSIVFPPGLFAELLNAPETLGRLFVGEVRHDLYRRFIDWEGRPTFVLEMTWRLIELVGQQLNDRPRNESASRKPDEAQLLTISSQDDPVFHHQLPFGSLKLEFSKVNCKFYFLDILLPFELRQLTWQAALGRTAVNGRFFPEGAGERGDLVRIQPGNNLGRILMIGLMPLGRALATIEAPMAAERLILLGLFLLTIVLAMIVAARLLEPILAMTGAARKIMAGDFTARLTIDRDDELGRLATSFNSMARGVEEGERLSRFVSESVREAARDQEREQAALEGVICEAVVLFAGLPGFKELQAHRRPVELIADLNRHLHLLARHVREGGGEIDKFIGDRILAVFHPARCGGREEAVRRALEAAGKMRSSAQSREAPFQRPLGVGLVFGPVLAGIMGTPLVRLEYTVIGDTVNLASRLCDVAIGLPGGGVVLDGRMARLSEKHGQVGQLDVKRVKGKSREVEVFRFDLG